MPKRRGRPQHPDEYLAQLEEWQRHQYDPGYYVGRPHPFYFNNRRPRWFGMSLLTTGLLGLAVAILLLLTSHAAWSNILGSLLVAGFSALEILAGLRFIRRGKSD